MKAPLHILHLEDDSNDAARVHSTLEVGGIDYVLKDRLSQIVPAVRRAMSCVEAVAERGRLEAQFVEAQKMEVIGQLAGGVAHDFNNILAVILGYGNVIMQELGTESHLTDTGMGMTEEVLPRLFEPFFTTKPNGKGTGLGLPTCLTIMKQCGGQIHVESQVDRGSTFNVYFPQVELPLDRSTEFRQRGPLPRGTETVLLLEDEPAVRELTRRMLEIQGYTVISATNGQEGLCVAREHAGSPIRLVVTDVVMPQKSGKVMAAWLTAMYPEVKVLFTSSYTDDAIAHHGVLDPGVAFLPKPYTPAALSRKVREILDTL